MNFDSLDKLQEYKRKLEIQENLMLQSAYKSGDVDAIFKAENYLKAKFGNVRANDEGRAILIDPFNKNINSGFFEKASVLGFPMLRAMSNTPIPQAILKTRKGQVVEFTNPQTDKYSPGFVIRKKRKTYNSTQEDKVNKKEQQEIDELTEFILNCGDIENKWGGEDFGDFAQKFIEDCLALDQGSFEIIRGRVPKLDDIREFYSVDGATIRLADSYNNERNQFEREQKINGYYPSYVQVIDGQIQTEWYPWELCLGIRNPQTNIRSNGYGKSELETLVNTVTDLLNASMYNSQYFRIGSNPKGILRVKNMNTNRIEEFRQNWLADVAGVQNAHKMPIIDADTMEWINTQSNNKDMEYHKYMEFLIKISCAIYTISPEEIGFTLEGTGTGGGLGNGDNSTELEYSRNKGLIPLLKFFERKLNKYIVSPKTQGKYEIVFLGLNQVTRKEELEEDIKKVNGGGMSQQDFYRKYSGKEPDFDEDIILNPIYLQYKQMMAMGDPNSNEYMDDEYGNEDEDSANNPFLEKAVTFVDQELNQPT